MVPNLKIEFRSQESEFRSEEFSFFHCELLLMVPSLKIHEDRRQALQDSRYPRQETLALVASLA